MPALMAWTMLLLALSGCYPELDWRPLTSAEGRFTVLMPARSRDESRSIAEGVVMRQWTAPAGRSLFAAGYADYADAASGHIDEVRNALAGKSGARLTESREFVHAGLRGHALTIMVTGADAATPLAMHVRLFAVDNRLYQLTVISQDAALASEDLALFFDSFELAR